MICIKLEQLVGIFNRRTAISRKDLKFGCETATTTTIITKTKTFIGNNRMLNIPNV